ncbi:unnamed protein product [Paramecium sonneborni]|uniref:Uncharacterized protein n=1 Tax=Paramecium sonneborni TaxID=65129 RepID=A0A8S1RJ15_9CILI|nr:unnamed protein product [Paramecium sonneborni]
MLNQCGWNLLEKPIIFNIGANTTELSLADLPPKARKVKLYVYYHFGYCVSTHKTTTWSLYTKVDIIKIAGTPYQQQASNDNTQTGTFMLDERKIIEVSRNGDFPSGNFQFLVEVLAYK